MEKYAACIFRLDGVPGNLSPLSFPTKLSPSDGTSNSTTYPTTTQYKNQNIFNINAIISFNNKEIIINV